MRASRLRLNYITAGHDARLGFPDRVSGFLRSVSSYADLHTSHCFCFSGEPATHSERAGEPGGGPSGPSCGVRGKSSLGGGHPEPCASRCGSQAWVGVAGPAGWSSARCFEGTRRRLGTWLGPVAASRQLCPMMTPCASAVASFAVVLPGQSLLAPGVSGSALSLGKDCWPRQCHTSWWRCSELQSSVKVL